MARKQQLTIEEEAVVEETPIDETIPGGIYMVNDVLVDAHAVPITEDGDLGDVSNPDGGVGDPGA
jgi:hypothetical protein